MTAPPRTPPAALRTFIAVALDGAARAALAAWMAEVRPALPGFRWTEPENLHLTLRFLGDTAPGALPRLCEALAAAAGGFPAFSLTLRGAGAFPHAGAPRVIWAGAEGGPVLPALRARLEERVRVLGWAADTKPFRPHVTLARARDPRPRDDVAAALARVRSRPWGTVAVDEVLLVQSTLTPAGPVYTPLERFALRAG